MLNVAYKQISLYVTLSITDRIMRRIWAKRGFTLVEILVVLAIIGFLVAMIVPRLNRMREDAAIITCLNEMKSIKEAIRDRFYLDLGLIPEDSTKPEFAIRYLCLKDDSGDEYDNMLAFLTSHGKDSLIVWDKYSRRGWRGPYMEQETRHDYDGTSWWPVIVDPWDGYYYIYGGQDKNEARIVCFGANGIDDGGETTPLPADTGDDLVMFIFGTQPTRRP